MNEKFGNGKKMILSLDSFKATKEETVLFKVDDGTMKVNFQSKVLKNRSSQKMIIRFRIQKIKNIFLVIAFFHKMVLSL